MFRSKWTALSLAILCVAAVAAVPARAQQRPLLTEDPRVLPEGTMVLESGVGYAHRARYPVTGLEGNRLSILSGGALFGFGRIDFQLRGTMRNNVWLTGGGTGLRADWGDGEVSTRIAILGESGRRPDVSFQVQIVLPNASNEDGLGTDGTHFFANILAGKSVGPVYVHGKIGLGLLDDAERAAAQQDVMTYGLAGVYEISGRVRAVAEVSGRYNPQSNPTLGGEERGEARAGVRWDAAGMEWGMATTAGLTRFDHRVGIVFAVSTPFTLW